MSQDVFQSKIDQTFEGCNGVVGIADDIVVFGKTAEEHDENLHGMMERCQNTGLKLNPEKCFIKQKQIKFCGVICNEEGIKPDPSKVSALKQMTKPRDRRELQTFLGLATYMGPFIPNLSSITAPLREILKKKNTFEWNENYQRAFDEVKQAISEEITLNYFDSTKEVVLQVDASTKGLGAALIQEGKPVAFASKSLTDVETRYANIEREMLAVVYGCERFHTYLFGRPVIVHTDHKPLESIHLKHLTSAPPRLQRMLLRLQPYDLTIKYIPGKDMLLADALSRLSPEEKNPVKDMNVEIHEVCPQFSSEMIEKVKLETTSDQELMMLKTIVHEGWPTSIKEVPQVLKPYWCYRDEISIENGILMKGQRIIIPSTLQVEILGKLHAAHQGAEKTKLRARTSVFWRKMNEDIDKITKSCRTCQEFQPTQTRQPLIPTEIPPRPWHTIATDLFYLDNTEYLLVSDYYSKYPFVRKIPKGQSNSKTIIAILKQIFSEQGIPEVVRSDNGPHYSSKDYREIANEYGFQIVTSSPHYPRSNGYIESQVKTVKAILAKAKKTETDPNIALLCLRSTPIDNTLPSPAELLMKRKLKDNLPRKITGVHNSDDIITRLEQRQEKQKQYHDQHVKPLPALQSGQSVSVQNPSTGKWSPATIKEKIFNTPRSYQVDTPTGELRRNRIHLRELLSTPQSSTTTNNPDNSNNPDYSNNTSGRVTTRSGRVVKPPDYYA
ncbi:Retrovirus-related Pol poly from transposon [Paramuricea clavata]|uniref:Retrovirus-related Pol poly from transposon n=1 Tax=Paramuricea clavata TaxID=317549 RepID=A0A7D9DZ22_PARCT|nr:Retrovirus-related Pol poly from transposon [Paramuricea clavata]